MRYLGLKRFKRPKLEIAELRSISLMLANGDVMPAFLAQEDPGTPEVWRYWAGASDLIGSIERCLLRT